MGGRGHSSWKHPNSTDQSVRQGPRWKVGGRRAAGSAGEPQQAQGREQAALRGGEGPTHVHLRADSWASCSRKTDRRLAPPHTLPRSPLHSMSHSASLTFVAWILWPQ